MMRGVSPELRFWSNVKIKSSGQCWEWQAYKNRKGYGLFIEGNIRNGGKSQGAHRWAWQYTHGKSPGKMMVCHKCDNPGCVNPNHLYLGTNADNQRDAYARGRANSCGERGRNIKLNTMQVRVIRRSQGRVSSTELGKIFGISQSQISRIWNNQSWVK